MSEQWNPEQIKFCEDLSKLIEKQTGVKREPKDDEVWYCERITRLNIIIDRKQNFCHRFGGDDKYDESILPYVIHPLYSVEEVLEIIMSRVDHDDPSSERIGRDILSALCEDNLKTALLKLAVAVMKGE